MPNTRNKRDILKPEPGKSFDELVAELRPRPRYVGPGKWKQALERILAEEERSSR